MQELFDDLCAMLNEASLVLRTFEDNHLNTCHGVKAAANRVLALIGKFVPDFQKSNLQYYCSSLCFPLKTVFFGQY